MQTTASILHRIRQRGFDVKTARRNGMVEMTAVPVGKPSAKPQVARSGEGVGDEPGYRAACLLASAVGISLEQISA